MVTRIREGIYWAVGEEEDKGRDWQPTTAILTIEGRRYRLYWNAAQGGRWLPDE